MTLSHAWSLPPGLIPFDVAARLRVGMGFVPGQGFQVPAAGVYRVHASILVDASNPLSRMDFWIVNDTQHPDTDDGSDDGAEGAIVHLQHAGYYLSANVSGQVECAAGDVVCVKANSPGVIYGSGNWTAATIERVSA
jgi:hypothetical protein